MSDPLPIVLVPGLNCSARLYAEQIPALWRFGPVFVADHTRDDTISAIARRILAAAPPRFALAGLSMGGYISFEIVRQAAERVAKLALLDTGARAESPEQTQMRRPRIELARAGHVAEVSDSLFPILVHPNRHNDEALKRLMRTMAEEVGAEAFLRQQQAIMARPTPPALSQEIAAAIPGARLVVVPDCGHMSTLERPQAVAEALVDWMRS
jgi:pimeloyl-ACP methyl ester carboxylesterase